MSTSCSLLRTVFPTHLLRWSGAELARAPVRSCCGVGRCQGDTRACFSQPGTASALVPLCSFATDTCTALGRSWRSPRSPCRVPGSWGCSSPPCCRSSSPTPSAPGAFPGLAGCVWLCSGSTRPAGKPTVTALGGIEGERGGCSSCGVTGLVLLQARGLQTDSSAVLD